MECGIKSGLKPPPQPITATPATRTTGASRYATPAAPLHCSAPATRGRSYPQIEAKASILAYGSSTHFGAITCTSDTTGLTCRNRGGHGFFLSRASWRTF